LIDLKVINNLIILRGSLRSIRGHYDVNPEGMKGIPTLPLKKEYVCYALSRNMQPAFFSNSSRMDKTVAA
jgi:hypothetical protein